jgi:hypothetical protein
MDLFLRFGLLLLDIFVWQVLLCSIWMYGELLWRFKFLFDEFFFKDFAEE